MGPYGSLCVLSIVKRATVYLHMIANDFESLSAVHASLAGSATSESAPVRDAWSRLSSRNRRLSWRNTLIHRRQ